MTRRLAVVLAVLVVGVGLAGAALIHATTPAASSQSTVAGIAGSLRCPSCDAESVAASDAPIARSMQAEIRRQVAQGRSPQQVRAWFRARYGDRVLLAPDARGPGLLLWLMPVLVMLGGLLCVGVVVGRRSALKPRERTGASPPASALGARAVAVAILCVVVAGTAVPLAVRIRPSAPGSPTSAAASPTPASFSSMDVGDWVAQGRAMDQRRDYPGAVQAYRKALGLAPASASVRTALAFDLVRSHRPAEAASVVRTTARRSGPERAVALLVLGLSQRARAQPSAMRTFRTFLAVAPHHPAAAQVRRLLREGS